MLWCCFSTKCQLALSYHGRSCVEGWVGLEIERVYVCVEGSGSQQDTGGQQVWGGLSARWLAWCPAVVMMGLYVGGGTCMSACGHSETLAPLNTFLWAGISSLLREYHLCLSLPLHTDMLKSSRGCTLVCWLLALKSSWFLFRKFYSYWYQEKEPYSTLLHFVMMLVKVSFAAIKHFFLYCISLFFVVFHPLWPLKVSSPKNENSVIFYSPSCCSKTIKLLFIFRTQMKTFYWYLGDF